MIEEKASREEVVQMACECNAGIPGVVSDSHKSCSLPTEYHKWRAILSPVSSNI